ncbi:hypothetical protein M0812_23438 [Anaeramoeba flamelloides]|uniref:Phosphatidic acid phosphatase type 2/haloperoxidase domain-containing protein n=1 Tax=Anaeramoeba flamelloides TaxID=1746091 RepID=A0AAV7YNL2_9EUKA|nr:hypothetical protein M0812_23438 [Anaeramoeba flamelloides]
MTSLSETDTDLNLQIKKKTKKKKKKSTQINQINSQLTTPLISNNGSESSTYMYEDGEMKTHLLTNDRNRSKTVGKKVLKPFLRDYQEQIKKPKNYFYEIPSSFELWWYKFDTYWISAFQKYDNNFTYYFSLAVTFSTTIEIAILLPVLCYLNGYDTLANELAWIGFFFMLVSSLPKRFIWRYRPYMRGRAKQKRNDYTSSFPSRAVTGALVCPLLINFLVDHLQGSPKLRFHWYILLIVIILIALTSYARIYFGVHYPSDCVFGIVQGLVICLVSFPLYGKNLCGCTTCLNSECYSTKTNKIINLSFNNLSQADWGIFVILFILFAVILFPELILILIQIPPMTFICILQQQFNREYYLLA